MTLDIVKYGAPVLRKKGARVEKITPEIKRLVDDMLETMHEAKGVGLAAQQVGVALQLAVIDVRGMTDRPSTMEMDGKEVNPEDFMPMAIINPEIMPLGEKVAGPEGCLSFPEIYNDVVRPSKIDIRALQQDGKEIQFRCGGLLARAIQHEADHLNGILFIDRMSREDKEDIKPLLEELQNETKIALKKKTA
jgi:peptide deformylase